MAVEHAVEMRTSSLSLPEHKGHMLNVSFGDSQSVPDLRKNTLCYIQWTRNAHSIVCAMAMQVCCFICLSAASDRLVRECPVVHTEPKTLSRTLP